MKHISLRNHQPHNIWFVSDLHLGHNRDFILKPRGYATVEEAYQHTFQMMHQYIGPDDIVFNLGDMVIGAKERTMEYANRLVNFPCKAQYFIWGNHNAGAKALYDDCRQQLGLLADDVDICPLNIPGTPFTFIGDRANITINGVNCVLDHFPLASWEGMSDSYMLHGHCHRNMKDDKALRRLDLSWEWMKRPVNWDEIHTELKDRKFNPVDHHGKPEANAEFFETK